jgi:hypothetical protein
MAITLKTQFKYLQSKYAGRVLIMPYAGGTKELAFSPLASPVDSSMKCGRCGYALWNATNFVNTIHFCPDKEYGVTVTDYVATQSSE